MSHLFDIVCECVQNAPTSQDILQRAANTQLCTMTQCFESLYDLVPMHLPTAPNTDMTWVFCVLGLLMLLARPPRTSHKPHNPDSSNDPPPPPPSSTA